jgi:hypothetical protein
MDASLTKVSSKQLINLQTQLIQLSKNLLECYDTLSYGLKNLNEDWKDDKFDEFNTEFNSNKEQIREIGEKYQEWATTYLPPRIELTQKAEKMGMGIS